MGFLPVNYKGEIPIQLNKMTRFWGVLLEFRTLKTLVKRPNFLLLSPIPVHTLSNCTSAGQVARGVTHYRSLIFMALHVLGASKRVWLIPPLGGVVCVCAFSCVVRASRDKRVGAG